MQSSLVVVRALYASKVLIRLLDLVPCMRQNGVVSLCGVLLREFTCACIEQPHLRDYRRRSIVGMGRMREERQQDWGNPRRDGWRSARMIPRHVAHQREGGATANGENDAPIACISSFRTV